MANTDQVLFALVPISILGSVLNWSSFYTIRKLASFKHSFGYLSSNQALADALHSTVFLLYFCPMALLDNSLMKQYSHICGFILLFFYELSVLTHLLISLNRLFSVWFPIAYDKAFNLSKTKYMIFILWMFELTFALCFYEYLCHFYFDEKIRFLTFTNSPVCGIVGWYGDFLKNVFIVAIIMTLDICTLIKVKLLSCKLGSGISPASVRKLSSRDRRFLRQTVIQGSVFMLELLTYFFIPQYFENRWIVFFGTSFAWVAVHVADGLIVILCNPDVRNFIFRKKKSYQVSTTIHVSVLQ